MAQAKNKNLITVVVLVIVGIIVYAALTMPDNRTASEKLEDAANELSNGLGDAAKELQDRTPGERIGDEIQEMGESIERNTDNQ